MATTAKNAHKKNHIKRLENGNIELYITVNSKDVEKARKKVTDHLISHVQVPGFRKGKAPRKKAESQLNQERVKEETLKLLLPDSYNDAVKKHNLNPIINPQIHIEQFAVGTDLKFKAVTAEMPDISLGNYKSEVKKLTSSSKILVPGKEEKKPEISEIIKAAQKEVKIKIPEVMIEQESTRLLSQFLDQLNQLGLTLEQYTQSRNTSVESLKDDYRKKAESDLILEFMLRKIADQEGITVEQKDLEEALKGVEKEEQKQQLAQNPYLVANVIRQQKTLEFLQNL